MQTKMADVPLPTLLKLLRRIQSTARDSGADKTAELEEQDLEMKQTLEELKGKVRVFVQVHPLPPDEAAERVKNLITFSKAIKAGGKGVDLHLKGKVYHFTVDERFSEDASQEDIYKEISPLVQTAHDGFKVSIFAYGQTGSGKTHTVVGSQEET